MPGLAQPHEQAKIQRYVLEGFTGGIRTEDVFSRVQLGDTECTCANNVEFWPVGTISKRQGKVYQNSTTQLSGAVIQLFQWWSTAGSNYLMAFTAASGTCSGQVHYMNSAGRTQTTCTFTDILTSGQVAWNPEEDDDIIVETYGGSAVFCDGIGPIYQWDGAACCAMTTAPSGATCIRGYKNYLFVANAVDTAGRKQSRIWWTDPGDGSTWPASNYIDLDANDGDYIVGMELLGNELIVFKERKIYAMTYVGGLYEFYSEARISGVGCGAGGSIIPVFSELCFYGIENFYSFNGRDVESLADKLKGVITDGIQPAYRGRIKGGVYEEKDQLWWATPIESDTSSGNTHMLVLDYNRDSWTAFANSAASLTWYNATADLTLGDLTEAFSTYDWKWGERTFLENTALIYTGSYDGYIVCNTAGVNSDFDADYDGYWRSRWLDFGMPDINKRVTRIVVYMDKEVEVAEDNYSLYTKIYTDWDRSSPASTHTLSAYGAYPVLERRLDFTTTCRAMQLEIGSDGKDEPFTIHKIVIDFIPKGRTLV